MENLKSKWDAIFSGVAYIPTKNGSCRKKKNKRLERGLKTPEEKFILPILETLIELGGEAHAKDVLERVHAKMRNISKYIMVKEGLLDGQEILPRS